MQDTSWVVRLHGRVRPLVEAIAREEEREPAQVVRRLLDRALKQYEAAPLQPSNSQRPSGQI